MEDAPTFNIDAEPVGRTGRYRVTVTPTGGSPYTDLVNLADAKKRAAFAQSLLEKYQGLDAEALTEQLESIASRACPPPSTCDEDSQATMLVKMVEGDDGVELFHTPGGHDSEGFATVTVERHRETWSINSRGFRRWLAHRFYSEVQTTPSGQALTDALNVVAGKAVHEGREYDTHLRIAELDGALWVDLADADWRAVRVTGTGWQIIPGGDVPVRFIRRRGMLALPAPYRGGSLSDLRGLVNVPDDEQWVLTVAWLVAALRPGRPFPVLNLNGEQGCAKSTLAKMLRSTIDPAKPLLRRPPKDERDLMIAANNGWVVSFDNLSGLSKTMSDSLCTLATGGGFGARQLYTDDDEKLFDSIRPVIVNGIEDSVTRPDLLDRSVSLMLPVIPEDQRRDEDELWHAFGQVHPGVLGSLLDAVAMAQGRFAATRLGRRPRMAAFARWVAAAESALPWTAGKFMDVYAGNRAEAHVLAVESAVIGPPVVALLEAVDFFRGTAGDLLTQLNDKYADEKLQRSADWPKTRKAMGTDLRRLASNLRAMGYTVVLPTKGKGRHKARVITLEKPRGERSAQSASSANPPSAPVNGVPTARGADRLEPSADRSVPDADHVPTPQSTDSEPAPLVADRADHADRDKPPCPDPVVHATAVFGKPPPRRGGAA